MRSPCCCLLCLLLYFLLLSGTWANLEVPSPPCQPLSHVGTFTIRLLQTNTFQNTSFAETEGLGLLEDIKVGYLDKYTWPIHFCQPWVHPALPRADWDTIENLIKNYLHNFSHIFNAVPMQMEVPRDPAPPYLPHTFALIPQNRLWPRSSPAPLG
uniref:Uncharacterized protein n=1 Tax=Zosterops lateralis melanops TaxID=1220523 RepID=A0A8D2PRL3_ZOSLA